MKQRLSAVLCGISLLLGGSFAMANEFTVYVVRHAEKAPAESDPPLSEQGHKRALVLAEMLKKADIQALYSTPYRRTQQTAQPLAAALDLSVQDYRPGAADELIQKLKAAANNALVVGHSNTVPKLVRALGGHSEDLTEQDYGDLFVLTFTPSDDAVQQLRLYVPVPETP